MVVGESWRLYEGSDFLTKIQHCTSAVDAWGRRLRSGYREEINACRKSIEEIRMLPNGGEDPMLLETRTRLSILLAQEDAFWKQRARVYWLRDGDTNSRFFHAMQVQERGGTDSKSWYEMMVLVVRPLINMICVTLLMNFQVLV